VFHKYSSSLSLSASGFQETDDDKSKEDDLGDFGNFYDAFDEMDKADKFHDKLGEGFENWEQR
jgi:hypothetical protein